MLITMHESDWKILQDVKPLALDRLCQRILDEVTAIANAPDKDAHAKYGKIFHHIKARDQNIADAFDDLKRSNAVFKLGIMKRLGLINVDELAQFSMDTLNRLEKIESLRS